jgi:eukaryotic-like serine/threonine-protein kinase
MSTDSCPTMEDLERYAATLPTSKEVIEHVAVCTACRDEVEGIRADNALIGDFVAANAEAIVSEAGEPVIADSIPGYRILSTIRQGGQGVVYQAVQLATKRTVALKLLIGGAFATHRQRGRFEREVELVAGLRHPNIVTIFDSGVTPDGRHYYAMEYVDGVALDEYAAWKRTPLGPP